jgi:hypothetical protein
MKKPLRKKYGEKGKRCDYLKRKTTAEIIQNTMQHSKNNIMKKFFFH